MHVLRPAMWFVYVIYLCFEANVMQELDKAQGKALELKTEEEKENREKFQL